MMYEGVIYRPPSEAGSLIIQVTVGCSHNKCVFCGSYQDKQFKVRSIQTIKNDIEFTKCSVTRSRRVFLADGNALTMNTEHLSKVMDLMNLWIL